MLRAEDNQFLTESGAGTAMGNLLRRFWLPVLLSEELPEPDGPPKKIVVMGEELLAFRDTRGQVGVIDQYCRHRGANLWLGRNEECGIRCVYHGWKFDTDGTREHLGPTDLGIMHFRKTVMELARALQQGEVPPHLRHQDRYAVRSGACVTHKSKDLPAVMVERFGDPAGFVGRPRIAAAE